MIASPDAVAPPDPTAAFARAVLAAAAEVEAAETAIKAAILSAARAGDCARVVSIMERWNTLPAAEVLAGRPLLDVGTAGNSVSGAPGV